MKALEPDVLLSALGIQDELLGPTINFDPRRPSNKIHLDNISTELSPDMRDHLHAINGWSNASWFFHSPLQYWSCSFQGIAEDKDIINTVNEGSRLATSVNVTLRHSIVFSGKRFEDHRLIAADALVITLVHMLDSPVGKQWERKAKEIAERGSGKWHLYPADGRSRASTLYEFRFQPLSFQDDVFLAIAYGLTAIYFIISLSKLRALKSRYGLIVTVMSQVAVSIMSSFTICAIFKIDLSKIPRETYPLVILTVGLENIFRLINAVITTPPESSTSARMAEALGQTGHIALAGVSQNLVILWMLSKVVSSGVASFCIFAAIALTFDFFYLLTLFVAVLSVDVQRTELSDSLTRVSVRNRRNYMSTLQSRQTWSDSLLRGEAPVSTRVAGTMVMIGFVLIAQWHFFDNENFFQTASRFMLLLKLEPQLPRSSFISLLSIDINQARTPTAWLRLQDHETAHEVIQVIKPSANSYIAQVYDPLIFVLDGADRTPNQFGVRPLSPAIYDFVKHQSAPFIVTVILIVAAVSLLMNYLLWNESPESERDSRPDDDPLLSVKTLNKGHALDVVLLSASTDGVVASVGLDRWIRIWDVRNGGISYIVRDVEPDINPFPVLAIAIDNDSNWLAILSSKDLVALWNIPERRWGPTIAVEVKGRTPAGFFFGFDQTELINPVIVVRHSGMMTELHMETRIAKDVQICRSPLICVRLHAEKASSSATPPPLRIITSSKGGCVHVVSHLESRWISEGIELPCPIDDKEVLSIMPLPILSSFLSIRNHTVDLIDISTHKVAHTFSTKPMQPGSLRCFHSTQRRPQCGSMGLASLTLVYTCATTGHLILQRYSPQREGDTICFRDPYLPGSKTCCLWRETVENTQSIQNPGNWDALQIGYIVGVRKREDSSATKVSAGDHTRSSSLGSGLRRRGVDRPTFPHQELHKSEQDEDVWEVWSLSCRGEKAVTPLCDNDNEEGILLVGSLGPMARIGNRSIAVGLGNVIKVITVGHERFDDVDSEANDAAFVGIANGRRKKALVDSRKRSY
jgi:hypothetical protein